MKPTAWLHSNRTRRSGYVARVASAAVILVLAPMVVFGEPQDSPFALSVPAYDAVAPKAATLAAVQQGVSEQTGGATYSVPIVVPPGRGDMTPSPALAYSSAGALRGGVAVGWTMNLSMPSIERDPLGGAGEPLYMVGATRLVSVDDEAHYGGETYRAEFDDGAIRYEHLPAPAGAAVPGFSGALSGWIARAPSGVTHYYAATSEASDGATLWHLTGTEDRFGNAIAYSWERTNHNGYDSYAIAQIAYGANDAAGLDHHARIAFEYTTDSCSGSVVPPGAATDRHFGRTLALSARRLTAVKTNVKDAGEWRLVRSLELGYDQDELACPVTLLRAPLRYLTSVATTGYTPEGTPTEAPPITFEYGPGQRNFAHQTDHGFLGYAELGAPDGATARLLDFDADGLLDWVSIHEVAVDEFTECQLSVRPGLPGGNYAPASYSIPLPTATWKNGSSPTGSERCTFDGQFVRARGLVTTGQDSCIIPVGSFMSYHFVDYDGDGRVDLLTNAWTDGYYIPSDDFGQAAVPVPTTGNDGGSAGGCPEGLVETHTTIEGNTQVHHCGCPSGQHLATSGTNYFCCDDDQPTGTPGLESICGGTGGGVGGGVGGGGGDGFPTPDLPDDAPSGCTPGPMRAPEVVPGYENVFGAHPYVWRVYRNTGSSLLGARYDPDGDTIAEPPMFVLSPRPLPAATPPTTTAIPDPAEAAVGLQTLIDIDGDGYLDVVVPNGTAKQPLPLGYDDGDGVRLLVWRGHGAREFDDVAEWSLPVGFTPKRYGYDPYTAGGTKHSLSAVAASFVDLNGDGLQDLVVNLDGLSQSGGFSVADHLHVFWNTGSGFSDPHDLGLYGPVDLSQTDLLSSANLDANRGSIHRFADVDGDGLPDRIVFPAPSHDITATNVPRVYLNLGDRFRTYSVDLSGEWKSAQRIRHASSTGSWHVESDIADYDGDGEPDLARWLSPGTLTTFSHDRSGGAPRLLHKADNGYGGGMSFTYAPSTATHVVRTTGLFHNPSPRWVVQSVTTAGGFGQPEVTTTYRYVDAVYKAPSGQSAEQFVGFRSIEIENPSPDGVTPGSLIIRDFDYSLADDGRGHLVAERRYGGLGLPRTLETHKTLTWQVQTLFGGKVIVTNPHETIVRSCSPGMSESTCSAQTTDLYRRTETWTPFVTTDSSSEQPVQSKWFVPVTPLGVATEVMYLQTEAEESTSLVPTAGDRTESFDYEFRYGTPGLAGAAAQYFVQRDRNESRAALDVGGSLVWEVTGRTETVFNSIGLPVDSLRWITNDTLATTRRTFDAETGNILTVAKPRQVHTSAVPAAMTYQYDEQRLFVSVTTNELGHITLDTYDIGSGALQTTEGPNQITEMPPGCSFLTNWWECAHVGYEGEAWVRDGLKRVVEHYVSFDEESNGYAPVLIAKNEYVDGDVTANLPNVMREERLLDADAATWVKTETHTDGTGRVLRRIELRQIPGKPDAVTEYDYDEAGNLATVRVPDPRWDTGVTVAYTYAYDGNARVRRFHAPSGAEVSVTHMGRNRIVVEAGADGTGSTTKYLYDPYGRLSQIHEYPSRKSGGAVAITSYAYDDHDRMVSIVNADGDLTEIEHDWSGRRTGIHRGAMSWAYEFDLNGNMLSEKPPVPDGTSAKLYQTAYAYDALDRIVLRKPAGMGLSGPRLAELGIGPIEYVYDKGRNARGRLANVSLPWGRVAYTYDGRGLVTEEQREFMVDSLAHAAAGQSLAREYNALGQPTLLTADDGTTWRSSYDKRGLVQSVEWRDPLSKKWRQVADYERSLTGMPRTRNTSFEQRRVWDYDAAGRVKADLIFRIPWVLHSELAYDYTDTGDLRQVTGQTHGQPANFKYAYDARHRLLEAQGIGAPYEGSFTYTSAGNVATARVKGPSAVTPRDVDYEYGLVDPQAVDKLTDVNNGTTVAEFAYDSAGNMTNRITTAGASEFTWDAEDQLREAKAPPGTELYYYDHTGERVLAVSKQGVRFWFGPSETHFDAGGGQIQRWLHISDAGGPLARIENGTAIELHYVDALQNLIVALDEKAKPVASFVYGPFGEVVSSKGAEDHRRQFNSKEHDASTGLHYYGARYYDPLALRWISADPLFRFVPDIAPLDPQRHNLYSFSLNNPLRYYDPDGRNPLAIPVFTAARACIANPAKCAAALSAVASVFINNNPDRTQDASPDSSSSSSSQTRTGTDANTRGEADEFTPVLEVKRSQMPNIYWNTVCAQADGKPVVLHKQGFEHLQEQNRKEALRAAKRDGITGTSGVTSLDEYPFASSMEGGAGSRVVPVPIREHSRQGGLMSAFYTRENIKHGDAFIVMPRDDLNHSSTVNEDMVGHGWCRSCTEDKLAEWRKRCGIKPKSE